MLISIVVLCAAAPAVAGPTRFEKRLVAKINQARAAHGLGKVRIRSNLNRSARGWARHLLRADAFHHARLARGTSENLAWGTCSYAGPSRIVTMWMNSSGHRAALLRRGIRLVGPGVTSGRWRGHRCVRMAVVRFR